MFSGMLTLTHYLKFNSTCRERRIVIFYNIFLIFIGILIRPLCSIIIITLYLPLLLIYVYKTNRSKMKETIITILILIIFSLTFIILSYRVYNSVDKEYADFVIYKSSVFDNGQSRETLKLRNIKDSTIYNSFTNYYIPEKEYYNANYLDKLGIYKAHTPYEFIKVSINELPYKIKKAISKWEILFQQNYRWFFILFFILLLLCLSFNTNKKYFFRNLIIILWFILCLTSLSVLIKIEDRILYPSILMCFILLLETSDTYIGPAKDWFVRICMIALLLSCIFFIQNRFYEITKRQHGHDKIAKLMLDIKLHHSEKIFILDAFSLNILSSRLFYYSKNTEKIKWFSIEPGYLIFYKEYFEKQYKLTGTRNYKDLFLYASGHKNNFVFIYSGDRIKLVEEYNKNIHNINLPFMVQKQILKNVKIFSGNDYFYVYSIK